MTKAEWKGRLHQWLARNWRDFEEGWEEALSWAVGFVATVYWMAFVMAGDGHRLVVEQVAQLKTPEGFAGYWVGIWLALSICHYVLKLCVLGAIQLGKHGVRWLQRKMKRGAA